VAFVQHLEQKGDRALLNAMHAIRLGMSANEVSNVMQRYANVFPANSATGWLSESFHPSNKGEYWQYFMGYPPRNLIIYFDQSGNVAYTTWLPT
jgi:hypothetical protein